VTIIANNGVGSPAVQHPVLTVGNVAITTTASSSADPALTGQSVTYTAKVVPTADRGTIGFYVDGTPVAACHNVVINTDAGLAACTTVHSSNLGVRWPARRPGSGTWSTVRWSQARLLGRAL
jgi:hypothetical protein